MQGAASAPRVPHSSLDVIAIGDAMVDVIATCSDSFLEERGLAKGSMRLMEPDEADALYSAMGPARETSGGSAANSMAGVAALGGRAAFIGQTADDQLGEIFAHDMRSLGVEFKTRPIAGPPPTGRCLILVTPDAQRTMNTCPGASYELTEKALDRDRIEAAPITFLEGYLWGPEGPRRAMLAAAKIARNAGRSIAFTLSESLCIPGRREGVMRMIDSGTVDMLFGNEDEMRQLTGCGELADCLDSLSGKISTLIVTRGPRGAIAVEKGEKVDVPAAPVEQVVDTTGAGDLFAAGFIVARCRGRSLKACLQAGALAAAEIISHFGARPQSDLKELLDL